MEQAFNLTGKELTILTDLLERHFSGRQITCYLFGSVAQGDARKSSDIDILIESEESIRTQLSLFREDLEDSNIVRIVDVVYYEDAPASLVENARKNGVILWPN